MSVWPAQPDIYLHHSSNFMTELLYLVYFLSYTDQPTAHKSITSGRRCSLAVSSSGDDGGIMSYCLAREPTPSFLP